MEQDEPDVCYKQLARSTLPFKHGCYEYNRDSFSGLLYSRLHAERQFCPAA